VSNIYHYRGIFDGMVQTSVARILVVDDERLIRWGLRQGLQELGYQVDEAADGAEAVQAVQREVPDLVLLDYRLPDESGIDVLRRIRKLAPRIPVVMITAHASVSGAVEAMKEGAYDYIGKPFEFEDVEQTVARGLEAARLREEVAHQRKAALKDSGVSSIVAESQAMREVLRLVSRIAQSEATTILLLGETGVGKGVIARTLHAEGLAAERPFMHITCTALAETLLESELFGHEKGAFTDARTQKKGLFELADRGTIFLDEIGDLSPGLQGKLLHFLEEKAFRRVGGTRDIRVSVRIVAATNKDLEAEVKSGRFRSDLFFRLKVIPISIPPLRERTDDVSAHSWPGNVRELRNAIERAVLLSDSETLSVSDLPAEIAAGRPVDAAPLDEGYVIPRGGMVFEEFERDLVIQALHRTNGNRTRAAKLLGMKRDQIRYRIEKFDLA